MWGTQTPKKELIQENKEAGISNLVCHREHEDKVFDEPYIGKKGVFNSVAYIHYDRSLLQEEGVAESRVKVNHLC